MHHRVDPLLPQDGLDPGAVQQVALDQPARRDRGPVAEDQVVVDPDLVAAAGEQLRRVRPDISGTTGHQNVHEFPVAGLRSRESDITLAAQP